MTDTVDVYGVMLWCVLLGFSREGGFTSSRNAAWGLVVWLEKHSPRRMFTIRASPPTIPSTRAPIGVLRWLCGSAGLHQLLKGPSSCDA